MNFSGIISHEVYEKNQRVLRNNSHPHEESDNAQYPLYKTICCAICGAEMTDEERETRFAKGKAHTFALAPLLADQASARHDIVVSVKATALS